MLDCVNCYETVVKEETNWNFVFKTRNIRYYQGWISPLFLHQKYKKLLLKINPSSHKMLTSNFYNSNSRNRRSSRRDRTKKYKL